MANPGDQWESDDVLGGNLARVTRVAANSVVVFAEYPSGVTVRLVAHGPTALEVGDVVLIGDNRWVTVEPELWQEPRGIGVVRRVWDDRLLVETSGGLTLTEAEGLTDLREGNTVEFSRREGAVELLAEEPIRMLLRDADTDDVSRFKQPSNITLAYEDFGGYSDVVRRARHIMETQFEQKEHLDAIGARPVRGVLFSGPPGTGKTHLARVIAAASGAEFYLVSGPSIVSKYVGDTEGLLRGIFADAESQEKAIVFFDEIDSIAGERSEGSHDSSDRLVAQLLTEMDGFDDAKGNVIVLAATNRPEDIDPALRRPGRFDWEIQFTDPSVEDRLAILEVDERRLATVDPLPLEFIAEASEGWSGARLASVWTEAGLLAARDGRRAIDSEDLLAAFETVRHTMHLKKGQ